MWCVWNFYLCAVIGSPLSLSLSYFFCPLLVFPLVWSLRHRSNGQVPSFFFVLSHTFFPQIWRDSSFGTVSQCRKHADEMDHLPYIIRRTLGTRFHTCLSNSSSFFFLLVSLVLILHSLSLLFFLSIEIRARWGAERERPTHAKIETFHLPELLPASRNSTIDLYSFPNYNRDKVKIALPSHHAFFVSVYNLVVPWQYNSHWQIG